MSATSRSDDHIRARRAADRITGSNSMRSPRALSDRSHGIGNSQLPARELQPAVLAADAASADLANAGEAAAQNLKIKYVIETHLHADFVSGHRELAARSGAEIVFGCRAKATIPHRAVKDSDELTLGKVRLRILETPVFRNLDIRRVDTFS